MVFSESQLKLQREGHLGRAVVLQGQLLTRDNGAQAARQQRKKYRSSPSPPKLQFPAGGSKSGQASYVGTLAMQNIGVSLPGAERRAKKGSGRQMQKN